jgi:hypothetical protein
MGALELARYQQQWRFHIQMMLGGERTRLWRHAVPTDVTAQPKLTV